eukprot:1158549-Pelagomonas_calceolata.AAC.4
MPQSANGKVYTNTGSAAPAGGGLRSDDAAARRLSSPQGTHNTANHGSLCRGGSREQEAGSLRGLLAEEQEKSAAADLTIPSDCDDDDDEDEVVRPMIFRSAPKHCIRLPLAAAATAAAATAAHYLVCQCLTLSWVNLSS